MNLQFLSRFSIATKIVITGTILASTFMGASLGYVVVAVRADLTDVTLRQLTTEVENDKVRAETALVDVRNTVQALAGTPPLQGMIRASKNDGIDEEEGSTAEQWRLRLGTIFAAQMDATGIYDQMRYIDETGNEVVRVNFSNGRARRVSEDDLQYKGDRGYFIDIQEGYTESVRIYASPVELNREGSPPAIEYPFKPVMRIAYPVFDVETGAWRGIVIANVLFDKLLSYTGVIDQGHLAETFVVRDDGTFLIHPDQEKLWGGTRDLDTGITIATEFPEIAERLEEVDETGAFVTDDVVVYAYVYPVLDDEDYYWLIIRRIPESVVFATMNNIVLTTGIVALVTFLILLAVFYIVIGRLLLPLRDMSRAATRIAQGELDTQVEVHSHDEVGLLAESFNKMSGQLKEVYGSLEMKVQEKTAAFESQVEELENTKKALLNVLEDAEDSKRAIELEQEKTLAILESIGDGVFVIDQNRKLLLINTAAQILCGVSQKDALGRVYSDVLHFVHEDDDTPNTEFIDHVLETGEAQEMKNHTALVRADGSRVSVADSAAPVKSGDGKVTAVVVVFRDVSRERKIDAAKSEFVSIASHQLRTPLTGIRWVVERLLKKVALPPEATDYLKDVEVSAKRLTELVDLLLNVSRIEEGVVGVEPKGVDIVAFFKEYVQEIQPLVDKKNITLVFTDHPDTLSAETDPTVLRNIVQSLVSNALEYTPNGGTVELSLKEDGVDSFRITLRDTGIGIPYGDQRTIFNKFTRGRNALAVKTDGTGLGLYIVKQSVELLGGHIWFESTENKGTAFFVEFPKTVVPVKGDKKLL